MKMPHPLGMSVSVVSISAALAMLLTSVAKGQTTSGTDQSSAPATSAGGSEVTSLPAFSVSADLADPYNAVDTMSVARTQSSLLDTPMTARIITRDLLDTVAADSLYDATRFFPGINNGRGAGDAGFLDREDFRGFESNTITVDNFALTLLPTGNGPNGNFDPVLLERVEVVLGPDSILSPTGTPGGSMNLITKSPQYKQAGEVTYTFGNYDGNKATFDTTGPLPFGDGKMAYRIVAAFQDANTYIPGGIERQVIEAAFTDKLSDTVQLKFKYFGTQEKFLGAAADPNDNGWEVTDPTSIEGATIANTPSAASGFTYDGLNGDPAWAKYANRYNLITGELTAQLGSIVSMRLGAFVDYDRNDGYQAYPSAAPSETYDNLTGQVNGISTINPASFAVLDRFTPTYARIEELQNDYATKEFNLNGVTLQPSAGFSYEQVYDASIPSGQINLPNDNLFAPYTVPQPNVSAFTFAGGSKSEAWQDSLYVMARAGFWNDRIFVSGGWALIQARSNQYSLNANPALPASLTTLSGSKDTYFGGLLFKATKDLSGYVSYSSNAALTSNNAQPLWQEGKQYEFGVKAEFYDQRLTATVDHFQIDQTNIVTPNPLFNVDPVDNPVSLLNDVTNKGYEFNVTGGITKNLSIIASYTNMRYRDQYGRRARNVPDNFDSLMLNYKFTDGLLKDFSVFGALLQEGDVAGEAPPNSATAAGAIKQVGFYVAGYTVGNAGMKYHWGKYSIALNINNVTNEKFIWEPASRFSVSPYPGFNWLVTVGMKF
jgi:iron complex outermembrane receptor protein